MGRSHESVITILTHQIYSDITTLLTLRNSQFLFLFALVEGKRIGNENWGRRSSVGIPSDRLSAKNLI